MQALLKKKNRIGFFYKRILTLTEEPRLGFSKDGQNFFQKTLTLGEDTKVSKVDQMKFKLSYWKTSQSTGTKKEVVRIFKCNDAKQCDEWVSALLIAIETAKTSPYLDPVIGSGNIRKTDSSSALTGSFTGRLPSQVDTSRTGSLTEKK